MIRYSRSPFRDFEKYLRNLTGLNEDDIQVIIKQNNSKFIRYKHSLGVYTFQDLSEVLSSGFNTEFERRGQMRPNHKYDRSASIIIGSDNVNLVTKLNVNPRIHALTFDKKSLFNTILGFSPYWDYKSYYNEYYGEKNRNLSIRNEIHLKCDCIDGSVLNGVRPQILYSFVFDKPLGYILPETFSYEKIYKTKLNTKMFYLEDDNHEEVNFNGETLTLTLQMIKI